MGFSDVVAGTMSVVMGVAPAAPENDSAMTSLVSFVMASDETL